APPQRPRRCARFRLRPHCRLRGHPGGRDLQKHERREDLAIRWRERQEGVGNRGLRERPDPLRRRRQRLRLPLPTRQITLCNSHLTLVTWHGAVPRTAPRWDPGERGDGAAEKPAGTCRKLATRRDNEGVYIPPVRLLVAIAVAFALPVGASAAVSAAPAHYV